MHKCYNNSEAMSQVNEHYNRTFFPNKLKILLKKMEDSSKKIWADGLGTDPSIIKNKKNKNVSINKWNIVCFKGGTYDK